VREQLLEELQENQVQLQVESWPPPLPDLSGAAPPPSDAACRNPVARLAQGLARKHAAWLRDGDTRRLASSVPPPPRRAPPESRAAPSGAKAPEHGRAASTG
ncbi:unnamed protein product, partial [Effrenium voratum]